jgi:hypothetical protein
MPDPRLFEWITAHRKYLNDLVQARNTALARQAELTQGNFEYDVLEARLFAIDIMYRRTLRSLQILEAQ